MIFSVAITSDFSVAITSDNNDNLSLHEKTDLPSFATEVNM